MARKSTLEQAMLPDVEIILPKLVKYASELKEDIIDAYYRIRGYKK